MSTEAQLLTAKPGTRFLTRLGKFFDNLETLLVYCSGIVAMLLSLAVFAQIICRIFGTGIPGVYEAGEASMVIVVFFALSWIQKGGHHIRMDMVVNLLPQRYRAWGNLPALLASLAVLVVFTWRFAARAYEDLMTGTYQMGLVKVPYAPFRIAMAVGGSMMCIRLLIQLKQAIFDRKIPGE